MSPTRTILLSLGTRVPLDAVFAASSQNGLMTRPCFSARTGASAPAGGLTQRLMIIAVWQTAWL
ncbi:MAG: hypothetical protein C0507_04970 [Cyanobacteria bacterium PR.3.49]|nr:hypothetical protein [Cyanobacteria bacterium PR.3.49]